MAITFVGSKAGGHNATTAQSVSLTDLLNSSGAAATLQQDDLAIVTVAHSMATTASRTLAQLTPAGYGNPAGHTTSVQANDSNAVSLGVSYKVMGVTPDTTISIPACAAATNSISYTIEVWRGVDLTTPFAGVTPVTSSGSNTGLANPGSISTPASPSGCVVLGCFGAAVAAASVFTNTGATAYDTTTNVFKSGVQNTSTNRSVSGMGAKTGLAVSTAFDAAITGSTTTNTGSWATISFVLKPAASLATLTWGSGGSVNENSANGTAVGTVGGRTSGSTLALQDSAGGRFAINSGTGQITIADTSQINYETATSHSITVRETLTGAIGSPKDTVLTVSINDVSAPAATDWFSGTTPSIADNAAVGSAVATLNKIAGATLAVIGGTGSALFEVYDTGDAFNTWGVRTKAGLTAGTYTLQIRDTTNGPAGSGEDRTDTLSITVTSTARTGRPKVSILGTFTNKPAKVFVGGVWVEKPAKFYSGGVWTLAR